MTTKLLSAILKKIWAIDVLSYDHERRYKPEALSLRVLEPILVLLDRRQRGHLGPTPSIQITRCRFTAMTQINI